MDLELIKEGQGYRSQVYKCTEGHPTIGYGHKLTPTDGNLQSITHQEAEKLLECDINRARKEVQQFFGSQLLSKIGEVRAAVLVDMAYNMGSVRWPKFTEALSKEEYNKASELMMATKYAKQVGKRVLRNASIIKTGQFVNYGYL